MRIFADENVACSVIEYLKNSGHDAVCIATSDLQSNDVTVLEIAFRERRALLTFDSDFGTLTFKEGLTARYGIIFCRTHMLEQETAAVRIAEVLSEVGDLTDQIVVIDDRRHRLRSLPVKSIKE